MTKTQQMYEKYWKEQHAVADFDSQPRFAGEIIDTVAKLLKQESKVLDVGCGDGSIMKFAEPRFDEIHGCDISLKALSQAAGMGLNTVCADLNANTPLPYRSEIFDAISCLEVIEHIIDPLHLLKDIHRVLSPQGQLILSTPNIRYFRNIGKLIFKGEFPHTTDDSFIWGGGHIHYFTRKDLGSLIKNAGFNRIVFHVAEEQFVHSWKRRLLSTLTGKYFFGEWLCGSIIAEVFKA